MIPYSGPHFQTNRVNDWPQAVVLMPAGTWVKAIDNVQLLSEARSVNPGVRTVLRHFDGGWQQFDFPDHAARRAHARRFFESFVDGTFMEHAANVDAIEEMNEYNASSHDAADREKRVLWARACCEEWSAFRDREQRVSHIRLVVGNVAIGNDMPLETARAVAAYEAIAGYHPYVPFRHPSREPIAALANAPDHGRLPVYTAKRASMRLRPQASYDLDISWKLAPVGLLDFVADLAPNGVMTDEWPHLSGRWTEMDARFRAEGIEVDWLGTEAGPIGYYDWGGLDPMGGWRHSDVCAGDVELYLQVLDYWTVRALQWNVEHGGRMLGQVLYNSGGTPEWREFETTTPELRRIAELMATYVAPDPEPEPEPEPEPAHDGSVAREPYNRTYVVIDAATPLEEAVAIFRQEWQERPKTVGPSFDDAGIGCGLRSRTVKIYNKAGQEEVFRDWYGEHYPGAALTFAEQILDEALWAPVGTIEQRESGAVWPGAWEDDNPYGSAYQLRGQLAYHTGADLNLNAPSWNADRGAPAFACAGGVVTYAGRFNESWGNLVVIRHPSHGGFYSRSAHLMEVHVRAGDVITRGQAIGRIGGSDVGLPDHLHFDISPTEALALNPGDWPGSDLARLRRDYVDPRAWISERR